MLHLIRISLQLIGGGNYSITPAELLFLRYPSNAHFKHICMQVAHGGTLLDIHFTPNGQHAKQQTACFADAILGVIRIRFIPRLVARIMSHYSLVKSLDISSPILDASMSSMSQIPEMCFHQQLHSP
jgi:hypothetical protein